MTVHFYLSRIIRFSAFCLLVKLHTAKNSTMADKNEDQKEDKVPEQQVTQAENKQVQVGDENAGEMGLSPSKASYLRKLTAGLNQGKPRSQLARQLSPAELAAASVNGDVVPFEADLTIRQQDLRNLTQDMANIARSGSPNKQSVLVRRVMQDGRVVSGLEAEYGNRRGSELMEDDQGTLESPKNSHAGGNTVARESNIVNYATNEGTDSRMRSTMYISGKSQKFAMNKGQRVKQGGHKSPTGIGRTMIINLGERTQTDFNAKKMSGDVDMIVGVTDIATGATHVQNPAKNNFNPKLKPKQTLNQRRQSDNSGRRSSLSLTGADNTNMQTTGAQATDFMPPSPGVKPGAQISKAHPNADSTNPQIYGLQQVNDPMMISAISPSRHLHDSQLIASADKTINTALHDSLHVKPVHQLQVDEPVVNKKFKKPEMAEISVTNVDPRSMIPSQSGRDQNQCSHTIRSKRLSHVERVNRSYSPSKGQPQQSTSRSPRNSRPMNDLKQFHQAQAQQYKEFVKKERGRQSRLGASPGYERHKQSQSTLLDQQIASDGDKIDASVELRPGQMNQGTQPSEIMMASLEDQLNQLKQATHDSFFVPNPLSSQQRAHEHSLPGIVSTRQHVKQGGIPIQLLETVRSDGSVELRRLPQSQAQNLNLAGINVTHETFKLTDRSSAINSKMLSTYRGADNMKLRIIDQSVLKNQQGTSPNSTLKGPKRNESNTLPEEAQGPDAAEFVLEAAQTHEPIRKSILHEIPSLAASFNMISPPPASQFNPNDQLSQFDSQVISRSSPMKKIESFRALLRQESHQNEMRIISNQDNFKNLINPEVTRKQYTILGKSPSNSQFFIGGSQNQQLLTRKEELLHTVTDEFLAKNYPIQQQEDRRAPIKGQRFAIDPQEFRMKLQKKIEELRRLEVSDSQIIKEMTDSRVTSKGSGITRTLNQLSRDRLLKAELEMGNENTLFMTYLQHGDRVGASAGSQIDFSPGVRQVLTKQNTKNLDKMDSQLPLITPSKQLKVSQFEGQQESPSHLASEKVLIRTGDEAYEQEGIAHRIGVSSSVRGQHDQQAGFKPEADMLSFGEQMAAQSSLRHQKSGVTLASSGSSRTIKRIAKRYQREQLIVIFEDGAEICDKSPCITIELNSLLQRYYVQQKGPSSKTTRQEDINAQIVMFERAVSWILDQCGTRLCIKSNLSPEELTRLDGAAPKRFDTLYSVYGQSIQSLIQIDSETCILIAGHKDTFKGLQTSGLFKKQETALNMLNRIVEKSPINFDSKSTMPNATLRSSSMVDSPPGSPFKKGRGTTESPGKTFALTQGTSAEPTSPVKLSLQVKSTLSPRRYVSMTSREIIKASKQELLNQLTQPRGSSTRNQLLANTSGSSTMRQKRLASITMVTKGIKKGRLPPIKTPKQLDVFVFGERKGSAMQKKHLMAQEITGRTVAETLKSKLNESSVHDPQAYEPQILLPQEQLIDLKKKRVTHFHELESSQSLLDQLRQDGSSLPHSSFNVLQTNQYDPTQHEAPAQTAFSMEQRIPDDISGSLRQRLQAVNSIQQIASQGTYRSDNQRKLIMAKERISGQNLNVAKVALRERSPSYTNNKLVSQTSLQDNSTRTQMQMALTKRQKEQLKAEVNEHVLQNALKQREQWRSAHKLDDKQLYKLFSEFSSMMQISRMQANEDEPDSLKNRLAKTNQYVQPKGENVVDKLFPIGSNVSSLKYNLMRQAQAHKNFKLKKSDLKDFRVPIQVCFDYSEVLRPTKERLRLIVMNALGITTSHKGAKITYDQFLSLNSFLRYNTGSLEDYHWFCVKLFDPTLSGFAANEDCERIIDLLFDNQDEEGTTTKAPVTDLPKSGAGAGQGTVAKSEKHVEIISKADNASEDGDGVHASEREIAESAEASSEHREDSGEPNESQATKTVSKKKSSFGGSLAKKNSQAEEQGKDESVSSNIKKICHDKDIFKADGFLEPQKLYEAFRDGLLDVEDFKSALK